MASQPPAGYNPEASLLQGGTAAIVPVQGGGGMEAGASLPLNYNPEATMLKVGENPPSILAIRGGANGDKVVAYDSYVLEHYVPPLGPETTPAPMDKKTKKGLLIRYKTTMEPKLKLLTSFTITPSLYASAGEDNPTYKICPTPGGVRRLPTNFFQTIRRHIVIVDKENPTIWFIHNLEGDMSRFIQYMKLVPKTPEGAIDPNHYVIFTGNFFSPTNSAEQNSHFYDQFLILKNKNQENLFYITTLNESFLLLACNLMKEAYSSITLEEDNRALYPFYEPDIIVFKKQQILVTNGPLPMKTGRKDEEIISISRVLQKADPTGLYKEFIIVPTPGADEDTIYHHNTKAPEDKKFFKIDLETRKTIDLKDKESLIKCPKDESCQGFKGGYKLIDLKDDKTFPGEGIYLFRKNTDNTSFFAAAAAKPPEATAKPPDATAKPPEATAKPPEATAKPPDATAKPPEATAKPPDATAKPPDATEKPAAPIVPIVKPEKDEPFEPNSSAVDTYTQTIEVNAKEFEIRIPFNKQVNADWSKGIFTEEEASFLNALQFSPALLEETFGKSYWKMRLSEFLHSVVMSNCYKDTTLLTHIECSNSQEFIKQLYMQMFHRTLDQIYDEMGVPKPKMLSELIDEVSRLKQLGPTGGILSISKFDFTGDLFERFHKIYFDALKGEYYYDYAGLTDATREMLRKLKLYRVEDLDIDEITRKILERMKIPLPKAVGATPPPEESYKLEELQNFETPLADNFFTVTKVKGDGLCFYRAVLKALDKASVDDTDSSYIPSVADTMVFVNTIKTTLESKKTTLMIDMGNGTKKPVEQHFNEKYGPVTGQPTVLRASPTAPFSDIQLDTHIPIKGDLYKLTLQEYLDRMVDPDENRRPYADTRDAGIGIITAELKDIVIVLYHKMPFGAPTKYAFAGAFYTAKYETEAIPLSKIVFLEFDGGNHYNVLRIATGKSIPHTTKKGGAEEEVLDMGDAIERGVKSYRKHTLRAKQPKKKYATKKNTKQT